MPSTIERSGNEGCDDGPWRHRGAGCSDRIGGSFSAQVAYRSSIAGIASGAGQCLEGSDRFQTQPSWRKDVKKVELISDGPDGPVWREEGSNTLSLRTTEWNPPLRLVRTIADKDLGFGGRWIYELAPQDGGTRVTVTEEGEVYNPIFRFISRLFLNQAATIESYLTALAQRFGEQPSFEK